MPDVLLDDHALICVDCLLLHANGDLSGYEFNGGDPAELERMVAVHLAECSLTVGWGREQHGCKSNYTVIVGRDDTETIYEVFADDAADAIYNSDGANIKPGDSVTVDAHSLRTVQDMDGDCDCETYTFHAGYCDSCNQYIAGEFHAATIWKETS